jgi:hypothetical protein
MQGLHVDAPVAFELLCKLIAGQSLSSEGQQRHAMDPKVGWHL